MNLICLSVIITMVWKIFRSRPRNGLWPGSLLFCQVDHLLQPCLWFPLSRTVWEGESWWRLFEFLGCYTCQYQKRFCHRTVRRGIHFLSDHFKGWAAPHPLHHPACKKQYYIRQLHLIILPNERVKKNQRHFLTVSNCKPSVKVLLKWLLFGFLFHRHVVATVCGGASLLHTSVSFEAVTGFVDFFRLQIGMSVRSEPGNLKSR